MNSSTTTKALASVGSALAATRAARAATDLGADDMLGWIGLARRRSHTLENIALVGAGIALGAASALLFAPSSGRTTRKRIRQGVERAAEAADARISETREKILSEASALSEEASSRTRDAVERLS